MQLRNTHHKTSMTGIHRRRIAGTFRLGLLAVLVVALVYVTNALWQPGSVAAQDTPETQLGVVLSVNQEVPPVTVSSTAKGVGTVTVSADQTMISYTLTLTGPFTGAPTQAHIHAGPTGVEGPVIFSICPAAQAGVQVCPPAAGGEISGTLTEAQFTPQQAAGVATFADAVAAIIAGNAYFNVHTQANALGEIRGQIGPVGLGAILSSAAEVPPVTTPSPATGTATVAITPDHTAIDYTLTLTGPFTGAPTLAHIHAGSADEAGLVIFFICAAAQAGVQVCPPAAGGEVSGTLTEAEFIPRPEAGIATFADAIDALISHGAYVNVHTPANPSGEIRGQLGIALHADLSSDAEVPPVATPTQATGTALVVLNEDHSQIDYAVTLTGPFTGAPLQMHIHVGPIDGSGPIVFFNCATDLTTPAPAPADVQLCPPETGGPVRGTLTAASLVPRPAMGITTFAEAVAVLLRGGMYINVHTPANPSGEIRGQLEPVQPAPEVSFALDIQPIFNENCSCHLFGAPQGLSLAADQSYANLVSMPSSQVPSINRVEPGDPDNSYLIMKHTGAPGIIGGRMPQDNPTFFDQNPDLLELERQWILQGALNN